MIYFSLFGEIQEQLFITAYRNFLSHYAVLNICKPSKYK
jgi:hypothetical protein